MCKNVLPENVRTARAGEASRCSRLSLCLDGGHQRLNAHDVHDAGEIVGEYVQRHLGGDLGQTLHQEVRRPHPHLQRGEGMFGRLATLAHGLRVLIEALLYFLQHMLMLPACDSSLLPGRTTRATGGAMRESFPARSGVLPFAVTRIPCPGAGCWAEPPILFGAVRSWH